MKKAAILPAAPSGRLCVSAWPDQRAASLFWGYLLLIMCAELVTSLVDLQAGMLCHLALVFVMVGHGVFGRTEQEQKLALALTTAPFIRLLSLSLPLAKMPQAAWYPMVSIPLLAGAWYIIRQISVDRRELGLQVGSLPLQLLLVPGSLGLGALEYAILRPRPMLSSYDATSVVLGGLSLVIFTGFNEEFIFRGLLQRTGAPILGRFNLVYVSVLFGVLHIGYLSLLDVLFVTAVGLLFSYIVCWNGSILGVTLAHGFTNVTLFIVMPYLLAHPASSATRYIPWAIGIGSTLAIAGAMGLWRSSKSKDGVAHGTSGVPAPAALTSGRDGPQISTSRFAAAPLVPEYSSEPCHTKQQALHVQLGAYKSAERSRQQQ